MTKDPLDANLQLIADNIDEIEVTDNAEDADVLVCPLATKPLFLPDNLVAHCAKCFRLVQHRPHVPKTPEKLCTDCAKKSIAENKGSELMITKESVDDIVMEIKKKVTN
jgi:hypothetical protein